MKMKLSFSGLLKLIFAILPTIMSYYFYHMLPPQIPMQWSLDGSINSYTSKQNIWFIASIPVVLLLLSFVLPKIDPRRESYKKFKKYYDSFIVVLLAFLALVQAIVIVESLKPNTLSIGSIVVSGIGLLFMYIGNIMPKMKSNFFMGIKTPWTLADSDVWYKTHRLGGILWFFGGLAITISSFFFRGNILSIMMFAYILIISIIPCVMSYIWYKKVHF